jgi:enamine deaminase RidA (YjgF/YER057c/UK114 family)
MDHEVIRVPEMPQPMGYSQGVRVGNLLFVAGQAGIDAATETAVPGGFEAECRHAFRNLEAVTEGRRKRLRARGQDDDVPHRSGERRHV